MGKREKKMKESKVPIIKIGIHRKSVLALWIVLLGSVAFGIYNNVTATDTHTVHETVVIKHEVVDTNRIEAYAKNFIKVYYTWENTEESIKNRVEEMNKYLTTELEKLNASTVLLDIPTSSSVIDVQIWGVTPIEEDVYEVVYTVTQNIVESVFISEQEETEIKKETDEAKKTDEKKETEENVEVDEIKEIVESSYSIRIYMDEVGDMIVIKNPTICEVPNTSSIYDIEGALSNGSVSSSERKEITEFLETFFNLYSGMSERELAYYVKDNKLGTIAENYIYSRLVNPVFDKEDNRIKVSVTVEYLDIHTKATQVSQYILIIEEVNSNYVISDVL